MEARVKQEYPKALYKTRENYIIVKDLAAHEDAKARGFYEHWNDVKTDSVFGSVDSLDKRIAELDEKAEAVKTEIKELKPRKSIRGNG